MTGWIRALLVEMPRWARIDQPPLSYQFSRQAKINRRQRLVWVLMFASVIALTILFSIQALTDNFTQPAGQTLVESIWHVLFFPLMSWQLFALITALILSLSYARGIRQQPAWDSIRATDIGVSLTLRAWWLGLMFRMREALFLIIAVRLIFIGGLLIQLTSHQGGILTILTRSITPTIAPEIAVILLAAQITASILLPVSAIGLLVAIGLYVGIRFGANVSFVLQIILGLVQIAIWLALLIAARAWIADLITLPAGSDWFLIAAFTVLVDWGGYLLYLNATSAIWSLIPYSVFYGVLMLGWVLLQVALTDWILGRAIRAVEGAD